MNIAAVGDYVALTKPKITVYVVMTATLGFALASGGTFDTGVLTVLLGGTALVSGGTNALNMWWEWEVDARMLRTRQRPVASGRVAPAHALAFGLVIGTVGTLMLLVLTNALTAALAALTLASYVLAYTPLKRRTAWNTLVGCVPGALPILGGWTAGGGTLVAEAWLLFGLLYAWQLPHTLALAWVLREEYVRGGLRMPGWDDPTGRRTAALAAAGAALLLGISVLLDPLDGVYVTVASAAGAVLIGTAVQWFLRPARARARRVFLATLVYLPLVLATLGLTA
jgi:protoheme IX farnesyltransferase